MRNFLFILSLTFTSITLFGQNTLNNPSFEDEPSDATVPMGWFACERGTTPDILPGPWGVDLEPEEGETYLGLITRSDGSYESIGQRLPIVLKKDQCYQFYVSLAASDQYSGFNERVKFRVWGGSKKCKKTQILYESGTIDNTEWEEHKIKFTANKKLKYITIEAYHDGDFPVKGHILVDNISGILACSKV